MTLIRGGPAGPHTEDAAGYKNLVEDDRAALWNALGGRQGILRGFAHSLVAGQLAHQFTAGSALVEERDASGNAGVLARGYHLFNDTTTTVTHAAPDAGSRNDAVVFAYVDTEDGAIGAGVSQSGPQVVIIKGTSGVTAPLTDSAITTALGRGGWFRFADVIIAPSDTQVNPANVTFAAAAAPSVKPDLQVFTASGTWKKPHGAVSVRFRIVGGGGAGGGVGAAGTGNHGVGGGGGSGAYREGIVDASTLSASETVTVGAGGVGAVGTGAAGGSSTFAGRTANGGAGGTRRENEAISFGAAGGAGGSIGPGTAAINVPGEPGSMGWGDGSLSVAGNGGSGPLGSGGVGSGSGAGGGSDPGAAGQGYGAGGAGGKNNSAGAAAAGGSGAPGVVIIETYFG